MKFAAFVMTYNRPQIVKETIKQIFAQTRPPDFLLVVDNGDPQPTAESIHSLPRHLAVEHHPMGENLGPAGASAYALNYLAAQGYDYIYWGDDDNAPRFDFTLERVLHLISHAPADVAAAGAVGSRFCWKVGEVARLTTAELRGIVEVDTISGNSQLILRRSVVEKVGVPDARLFFGSEEPEYCLRMRRAGYRLLVDGDVMYQYRAAAGRLNLKKRKAIVSQYDFSALWRRYYETRNYIFMMNNTFQRPDLAHREAAKAVARSVFAWARGPEYGARFLAMQSQGIVDGYRGRMGRTILPQAKHPSPMAT